MKGGLGFIEKENRERSVTFFKYKEKNKSFGRKDRRVKVAK